MSEKRSHEARIVNVRAAQLLGVSLIFIVTACGRPNTDSETPSPAKSDVQVISQKAASVLGGDQQAAYALLRSVERGYSPEQILSAIRNSTISGSGEIKDAAPASSPSAASRLDEKSFAALFGKVPAEHKPRWTEWIVGAVSLGYDADQIVTELSRRVFYAQFNPEKFTDQSDADQKAEALEPARSSDWPFQSDRKRFQIRIRIRPGSRPTGKQPVSVGGPSIPGNRTYQIRLTVSPSQKDHYRMISHNVVIHTKVVSNYLQLSGKFEVRVQDQRVKSRTREVYLVGDLEAKEDRHPRKFPIRFGLHAKFRREVFLDGKRISTLNNKSANAFTGAISDKWANGSFTALPVQFSWEAKGLKYSGQDIMQPGTITLDPQGKQRMREAAERMRAKPMRKSNVLYTGQGQMTLDVVGMSKNSAPVSFFVYLHPDGSVTGKLTYNRINIMSGSKVGPSQVVLLSGRHTLNRDMTGSIEVSLENSKGKVFPAAIRGSFSHDSMSLNGMIVEKGVFTAETTFHANGLRRR